MRRSAGIGLTAVLLSLIWPGQILSEFLLRLKVCPHGLSGVKNPLSDLTLLIQGQQRCGALVTLLKQHCPFFLVVAAPQMIVAVGPLGLQLLDVLGDGI